MNIAGSGLMLAIMVALWLLVFVPAWFQRSNDSAYERETRRYVTRQIKQEVRANLHREKRHHLVVEETRSAAPRVRVSGRAHTVAAKVFRLRALRRALVTVLLAAMVAVVASVAMLSLSATYWLGVAGGFAVVCLTAWGVRVVGDRLTIALEASGRARSSAISALHYSTRGIDVDIQIEQPAANPRAWKPTELPAPKTNVGQILATSFAEVVPIEAKQLDEQIASNQKGVEESLDLDSIMQRRRQVG
ncbi:MAG: hypothetical protein KGL41_04735 [Actinomycetales bacterium]|nr:hypothetical protein [Actinomycetales bacterium]